MAIKLSGSKVTLRNIKREKKLIRRVIQIEIAKWLDTVKVGAKKELIQNASGSRVPYIARKKQPSTGGKLTSRTGKLRYMLGEEPIGSWSGSILYKKTTSSFKMQVKAGDDIFTGTIRSYISSINSSMFETNAGGGKKMPTESKATLMARLSWEFRGRPYLKPSAKKRMKNLEKEIQEPLRRIRKL